MKIAALTDLHGRSAIIPRFGPVLADADLVLLTGDNTHFGHKAEMQAIIHAVWQFNKDVLAVSGNCDYTDGEKWLVDAGIGLGSCCKAFGDLCFVGLSGSLPCPGTTPQEYTEEEFQDCLEGMEKDIRHPFILVTHQPPFVTVSDSVSPGQHVGSRTIRLFIEKHSPLVCFTGHIHEGRGSDTIGQTQVVNPGPARDGNYASLIVEDGKIKDLRIGRLYSIQDERLTG
jgi:Icc-related predicted phosphoesterase